MEFAGFLNADDSYTNIEFYDFMHPWSDDLPYTYDTFDYDYCDDQVRSSLPLSPLSLLPIPCFETLPLTSSPLLPSSPLASPRFSGLHLQRRQLHGRV
jgi:hypothetical protein